MKLNLGCGRKKIPGYINCDISKEVNPDKVVDLEKNVVKEIQTEIVMDNFINKENIKTVQKGMRQAVLSGSARSLASLPVEVAGKTGTAQFGAKGRTHAWFIGYAPYNNPEIVLTVLVEGGGDGDKVAVPVAKDVFEWYFSSQRTIMD